MKLTALSAKMDFQVNEDIEAAMYKQAYNFLSAGGFLSLSDWAEMDERERAVFVVANDNLTVERFTLQAALYQQKSGTNEMVKRFAPNQAVESETDAALQKVANKEQETVYSNE